MGRRVIGRPLTDEEIRSLGWEPGPRGWRPLAEPRTVVLDARANEQHVDPSPNGNADHGSKTRLIELLTVPELAARAAAAGPALWLIEGLWPADAYGVLGAEDKAGKTWAGLDLAVSVATGTPWLGHFGCGSPGPVLVYLGEGGERASLRRLAAIVSSRGGSLADLAEIRIGLSVPRLTDPRHVSEVARELHENPARLVVVDPLYLAAAGAKGSDLYAMGELLGLIQRACQEAGAALAVITHWNKGGEGSGARRFTGVGPGAWGRVLGSAAVERRAKEPEGGSDVLLRWEFTGSEIGDRTFRVRRRVQQEGDGLDAPLSYSVEVAEAPRAESGGLTPAQRRIMAALRDIDLPGSRVVEIGDRVAVDSQGPPLARRTIQKALGELLALGLIDGEPGDMRTPGRWWAVR